MDVQVVLLLTSAVAAFGTADLAAATTAPNNHKAERVELAIQDLYAELKTIDSTTGLAGVKDVAAAVAGIHLDDALSAKAKYVADSLRSMASGGPNDAGAKTATAADDTIEQKLRRKQKEVIDALGPYNDDDGRTAILVDRLMNRCVEIALAGKDEIEQSDGGDAKAKAADNAKAAEKTGGPVAARVDVDAVERSFLDVLQQLERLKIKSPGSSSTVAAVLRRRQNDAAVLSSSPSPHRVANGLFKFGLFNRQRSLSASAVADDTAGGQ